MSKGFDIGNSFWNKTTSYGHAKKVWRRIDEQLPGGYHITNMSDFASDGIVRSGMAVAYDTTNGADARDVVVIEWSDITTALTPTGSPAVAPGIDSLNIIGFIQEDVPVETDGTYYNYGTCNIVVKGEMYGYMFGDTVTNAATFSAALKNMTQKNGMSIRIID